MCVPTTPLETIMCALRTTKIKQRKGFSLSDWQLLQSKAKFNSEDEQPKEGYNIEQIQKHNKKYDGWMIINNKVFNVTPYIAYHPGGEKILLPYLGKDGTKAFNKYHNYISVDELLKKCYVGCFNNNNNNNNMHNSNNNDNNMSTNNNSDNTVKEM